jgi:hypothetical protein
MSLDWLRYFGDHDMKDTPIRTSGAGQRCMEKPNLERAIADLPHEEGRLYLSMHPANTLYYAGWALFSTVFALIADRAIDTKSMTHVERMQLVLTLL